MRKWFTILTMFLMILLLRERQLQIWLFMKLSMNSTMIRSKLITLFIEMKMETLLLLAPQPKD